MANNAPRILHLRGTYLGPAEIQGMQHLTVTSARRVGIGGASRAAGPAPEVKVASDELVRVVFADDQVIWMRADELVALRGSSSNQGRGATEPELIEIDDSGQADQRGALSIGIKVLEFFGINLKQKAALNLAALVDQRQLKVQEPGLYRCQLDKAVPLSPLPANARPPGKQPLLLFLHGTFSNFEGGYGGLMARTDDAAGRAAGLAREAIAKAYGERIYAFEHRTLTESPIDNALALAGALPDDAELHIVSHSRGGLVGELLALAGRMREMDPLAEDLISRLFEQDPELSRPPGLPRLNEEDAKRLAKTYEKDAERLRDLLRLLDAKRVRIRRFVRVACPARGTTLASGRLDRWLGVLQALVPESFVGDGLEFLLAVLKERTDARVMPGIEAMMPGSALTRLLNRGGITTGADLSVIAGDTQGNGAFSRLKMFLIDWFYGDQNDLVVNTGSMSGGLARPPGFARVLEDRGPEVTHTHYFRNPTTIGWLVKGLTREDNQDGGFAPISQASQQEPRYRSALQRRAADTRKLPIVVFVPGALGSALAVKGAPVWVNYRALMFGGMGKLVIDADGVKATEPLDDFYGPLIAHLARDHRVELFPYDWRLSVRDNAAGLQATVAPLLKRANDEGVALHIVAHSMGGLVVRAMIADGAAGTALWNDMGRLTTGSRLLMLGTPNRGSHEAMRWLTGFNPTQAKLALLDLTRGANGLIEIVRRYPGLVEMLPFGDDQTEAQFGAVKFWKDLRTACAAGFPLVEPDVFVQAKQTWKRLKGTVVDPERMLYVAGCARATVVDHELVVDEQVQRQRISWIASSDGDGTVSWDSGKLDTVKTWYAPDTAHDELCANEDDRRIFRAYVDLLARGSTDQLSQAPPARARGARERFELVQPLADAFPSEADLRGAGFGGTQPRRRAPQITQAPIKVLVRHADLKMANHAVMVGHYMGDLIVSAERVIDDALDGALSQAYTAGVYPGGSGTSMSFFADACADADGTFKGAVVLGLGQVGDLTAARLRATARAAMVDHARQLAQHHARDGERLSVGLSCVLVGSGDAGLSARESVESLLHAAIDANRRLERARLDSRVLIDTIEFIEVYEDIALSAGLALNEALKSSDLGSAVRWDPPVVLSGVELRGRKRRVFDTDRSWDQRVEILEDEATGMLSFSIAGQRARAEQQKSTSRVAFAEHYIARAVGDTRADSEVANTLFEMLLPLEFRLTSPDARGMVLLLDERSARFPWELLEDRWSINARPLAIDAGMLRQLKTVEYRPAPLTASDHAVLIVGDPQLEGWDKFPQLKGAENEAAAVRDTLRAVFPTDEVLALIGPDAILKDIMPALHKRAWRVLHLAGHGEHEWRETPESAPQSGMVVGKNVFLGAGEIAQMRHVPELVFINCCHLGRTDGKVPEYHKLAANLGAECIRMGARAVVAAGWAVDDAAAVTFARTFYAALLAGSTFRDAVRRARSKTHDDHPSTNTWGAYQCYGDPGWRLVNDGMQDARPVVPDYVSPRELVAELDSLLVAEKDAPRSGDSKARTRDLEERVQTCLDRAPASVRDLWLARADVAAALGLLYGEAGERDQAIKHLTIAIAAPIGECSLLAIEQCANLRVRRTADLWSALREDERRTGTHADKHAELSAEIAAAIAPLEALVLQAPNRERMSLIGSAHKRRAWLALDRSQRRKSLFDTAAAYFKAWQLPGDNDYYPVANGAVAGVLLEKLVAAEADSTWRKEMCSLIEQTRRRDATLLQAEHDFWRASGQGDLAVAMLLVEGADPSSIGTALLNKEKAIDAYTRAFSRGVSERNRGSVYEHLLFLIELTQDPQASWDARVPVALGEIHKQLTQLK
ncbi:CHAT domain-containing protein [Variovorax sp. dw_308]|uniref:CHAT domain-containing protein n=1 Tax=Variovorax sp. dw_308 TaxID=2721546 RepID=UPI001C43E98E|nr:CHAT domain-containing protein [Variovorax sp. dw_308]